MKKENLKKGTARKAIASTIFTVMTALFLAVTPVQAQDDAGADILVPSDVDNVKAVGGDGQVTLSWDVATDNVGVTGYNIYYGTEAVTNEGGEYTEFVDAGNVVEYVLTDLENGKTYYFAVTAYDAADNESENYSFEANATAVGGGDAVDKEAPQVAKTEARYQTVVKVVFSEEVVLPKDSPELAFLVTNQKTLETLDVLEALTVEDYVKDHGGTIYDEESEEYKKMSEDDKTKELKNTVVLITDPQTVADEYKVEAGTDIKDKAGNPIASGTSDTGVFEGSGDAEPEKKKDETDVKDGGLVADASDKKDDDKKDAKDETKKEEDKKDEDKKDDTPAEDKEAPKLVSATPTSPTELEIKFSEKIKLSTDPTANFLVVSEANADQELKVIGVVVAADGMTVKLTTDTQAAVKYSVVALEVKDLSDNSIAVEASSASFTGKEAEKIVDKIAPENVSNFVATVVDDVIVKLAWTASVNSAKDLADQVLYKSNDGSSFDTGASVGKDSTNHDVNSLVPGKEYWFKLTTKDESGNESDGVITKVFLPETGPAAAGLILASAAVPSLLRRKKKK